MKHSEDNGYNLFY